jgi:hypothetical protein
LLLLLGRSHVGRCVGLVLVRCRIGMSLTLQLPVLLLCWSSALLMLLLLL